MMPYCSYRRCRRVADTSLGKLEVGKVTGSKDGFDRSWTEVVYVCNKHLRKVLALLGYKEQRHANDRR